MKLQCICINGMPGPHSENVSATRVCQPQRFPKEFNVTGNALHWLIHSFTRLTLSGLIHTAQTVKYPSGITEYTPFIMYSMVLKKNSCTRKSKKKIQRCWFQCRQVGNEIFCMSAAVVQLSYRQKQNTTYFTLTFSEISLQPTEPALLIITDCLHSPIILRQWMWLFFIHGTKYVIWWQTIFFKKPIRFNSLNINSYCLWRFAVIQVIWKYKG